MHGHVIIVADKSAQQRGNFRWRLVEFLGSANLSDRSIWQSLGWSGGGWFGPELSGGGWFGPEPEDTNSRGNNFPPMIPISDDTLMCGK